VHVVAFFLTAVLSSALSERWRRSEEALHEQRIDYDELEALNRSILGNISSGLMIVNQEGRVRSFNRAAEQITGFELEEVYNRELVKVFPGFEALNTGKFQILHRTETVIVDKIGNIRTLGYATSIIRDLDKKQIGLLISFQDLTQVKEMEEQLIRADRLAAIGRLASAMAHEIRNPLASISGSVQLLMEDKDIRDEDRRLMGIVVKEADRLSVLLTDFLTYARPKKPQPEACDLATLLDDLLDVCRSDPRFLQIEISKEYQPGTRFMLDRDQIRQALWDLLINAAEAMHGEGQIRVGIDIFKGLIFLEDTGPGVPAKIREQIFEPFFTTKEGGTGLGLATVFGIVEAHGGSLEVVNGASGGARFQLLLGPGAVLN
jgi:two-component system sensor histidine kinase PilS (NtrC family)